MGSEPDLDLGVDHPKDVSSVPARPGAGAARPSNEAARAKTRQRQASQIEAMDAIQCLPGRTRLETMKVGLQTRRAYLLVLWQLASWALGLSTSTTAADPVLSFWEALI